MQFRLISETTFVQQPSVAFPTRNKTYIFKFMHEAEADSTWQTLTDKAKIILPKNVYVKDDTGKLISLAGTNINVGGFESNAPIMLKGDRVTIKAGQKYFDIHGNEVATMNTIFEGFISNVSSKKPIELELECPMWKLKQIAVPNKLFQGSKYTIESMMAEILQGTPFTVRKGSTSMADFRSTNYTAAQVLLEIDRIYKLPAWFVGNELRIGFPIYASSDSITDVTKPFFFNQHPSIGKDGIFQGSVISDSLEYKRLDDINLSAIAYSITTNELDETTKTGGNKSKTERLEVYVAYDLNGKLISIIKQPGTKVDYPLNDAGERHTFFFAGITDPQQLISLAKAQLDRYHYEGFRGSFKTFLIPFVTQGMNVRLVDDVLPERTGSYKVKKVKYSLGVNGFRQEIFLDFRLPE